MRKKEQQKQWVEVTTAIQCNVCGLTKEAKNGEVSPEIKDTFHEFDCVFGWENDLDGLMVEFDVCEGCLEHFISTFRLPPENWESFHQAKRDTQKKLYNEFYAINEEVIQLSGWMQELANQQALKEEREEKMGDTPSSMVFVVLSGERKHQVATEVSRSRYNGETIITVVFEDGEFGAYREQDFSFRAGADN